MLDERKVKLMTKLALYEETHGKEDFKISSYYRKDYASLHVIYAFLSVSVKWIDHIFIFNHFGRLCGCCDCVLRNCQSYI